MTSHSTDHIQLLVDERQYKQQINSKLDIVVAKVDQLSDRVSMGITRETPDSHTSSGISAKALLQTIQRIVADNDRLHTEVEDKTGTLDKLRDQVNDLLVRNQHIVDENNKYIEERNRNYNEVANVHKKKMDELIDQKEALQIEISDAAANMAATNRRFENLKKKYISLNEVFTSMKEDLDRERKIREKEKSEAEAAAAETNTFMQKYREENRRMKETISDRDELQQTLNAAKEQIDRLNRQLEERSQQYSREKSLTETQHSGERNNLMDQIEYLKNELRAERASSSKRAQEIEEKMAAENKQQILELKAGVVKELERRVAVEVDKALADAAVKAEEAKQQAVTEVRQSFLSEKERATKLLYDDFNVRLQQEIKVSFEKGKQTGFKEGTAASEKTSQALAQTQAHLKDLESKAKTSAILQIRELETQLRTLKVEHEKQINSLKKQIKHNLPVSEKKNDREELEKVVKTIVNDTFRALRTEFDPESEYSGETVLQTVRSIMVTKTLGALPKPEEEPDQSEQAAEPDQSEQAAEPDQSEQAAEPDQSEQAVEPDQSEQPKPDPEPEFWKPTPELEFLQSETTEPIPEPYHIQEQQQPEFTPFEPKLDFPKTEDFFHTEPELESTPTFFSAPVQETEQNLDDVVLREESSEEPAGYGLEENLTEDRITMTTAEQSESAEPLESLEKTEQLTEQSEEQSEKLERLEEVQQQQPEVDSIFGFQPKEIEVFPKTSASTNFFEDDQWDEDEYDIKKKMVKNPLDEIIFPREDENSLFEKSPPPTTVKFPNNQENTENNMTTKVSQDTETNTIPNTHPEILDTHPLPDIFPPESNSERIHAVVQPTSVKTDPETHHLDVLSDGYLGQPDKDLFNDTNPLPHPPLEQVIPRTMDFGMASFEEEPVAPVKTPLVSTTTPLDILGDETQDPLSGLWSDSNKSKKSKKTLIDDEDDPDEFLKKVKDDNPSQKKFVENLFDDESDLFS